MGFGIKLGAAAKMAAGAALVLAALGHVGAAAAQNLPGGTWGLAQPVNLAALIPTGSKSDGADMQEVSCASPGNCAAIGSYSYTTNSVVSVYPFVIDQAGGTWGQPATVSGIPSGADLRAAISCAAPGECAATWTYQTAGPTGQAYLIGESGGTWAPAQQVTLGTAGTWLEGVSCPAAGDCTAVGYDKDSGATGDLPFVMDSSAGTWGTPQELPGVAGLNSPAPIGANLLSVSCTSAGNCVAGGSGPTSPPRAAARGGRRSPSRA
jgi:hypothetical protein